MILQVLWGFVGILGLLAVAVFLSQDRKNIDWKLVGWGLILQVFCGVIILWTTPGKIFFDSASAALDRIIGFSAEGSKLVFGANYKDHYFAFGVLPATIFFSSLMTIGFYLGFVQKVVQGMASGIIKFMRVSGAEALSVCADVFVGQTEAPLVVKPYIQHMTKSEIMGMMTGGMATVSGGIMVAYVGLGADAGHLLAASLMAAPASLVMAKIIIPETEIPLTLGRVNLQIENKDTNILDAACRGAQEGLGLALNVAAMLIAFVALTAMLNSFLGVFPDVYGKPLTFERILGVFFSGLAFISGVEWKDCLQVGALLGKKMFLNELVAFMDLKEIRDQISERSFVLSTYALCGFANFSSIAIQIGGTGSLVPSRRKDLARLGLLAMLAGTLTSLLTATVAGMLLPK